MQPTAQAVGKNMERESDPKGRKRSPATRTLQIRHQPTLISGRGSHPLQTRTGSRGYFTNPGSLNDKLHCRNVDPLSDVISRACTQLAQSPSFNSFGFDS